MAAKASPAAPAAARASARRPMGYGGADLDRGQLFDLRGLPNDEKLVRLGYCEVLPAKAETYPCNVCGAEFVDVAARTGHGNRRHMARDLTPMQEDEQAEREERLLDTVAPLYLDKTAASLKG